MENVILASKDMFVLITMKVIVMIIVIGVIYATTVSTFMWMVHVQLVAKMAIANMATETKTVMAFVIAVEAAVKYKKGRIMRPFCRLFNVWHNNIH